MHYEYMHQMAEQWQDTHMAAERVWRGAGSGGLGLRSLGRFEGGG